MKVLFLSTVYPYPKDNGKNIILGSILEYLIKLYGEKNITYGIIGQYEKYIETKINIVKFGHPTRAEQIKNLVSKTILTRKRSIQESVLYSDKIKDNIIKEIKKNHFDLIIFDTIRTAQYLENEKIGNTKKILYLDDLFSIRYQNMIKVMEKNNSVRLQPLGNFKKHLPEIAGNIMQSKSVVKRLLSFEKSIIFRRENEIVNKFDKNLLISQAEVDKLRERTNNRNIYEVKPVLPVLEGTDRKKSSRFIFLGALNIPHNEAAILNFLDVNRDYIQNSIITIDIIGKAASDDLKQMVSSLANVNLLGFVEDLEALFKDTCAMIVPLIFGSGVKLKTLEAFSRGLPVISTDYGVEGINIKNTNTCIIENDISNFPMHMESLLNQEFNKLLSRECQSFFVNNYSEENVYRQYKDLLI
jgi:glycosyltransferase involved in cell wall biosynthesis